MRSVRHLAFASVLAASLACTFTNAAQRAFVSSTGNDANVGSGCLLTGPCRTFQAAHTAVDAGGEILALDGAGFGAVTITKSVTIAANPGAYAGISAATGNGVTVNTASLTVVLRGLHINGTGGSIGVSMTAFSTLSIENCVVSNFTQYGVLASSGSTRISDTVLRGNQYGIFAGGSTRVDVFRSKMNGSAQAGVFVSGSVGGTTTQVTVSDSEASGNNYGFYVTDSGGTGTARLAISRSTASFNPSAGVWVEQPGMGFARVTVSHSLVAGNGYGFLQNSGTFISQGDNTVRDNGSDQSGIITLVSGS